MELERDVLVSPIVEVPVIGSAVRVNDQYRIVFRFEVGDAFDVLCTDYH